MKTDRATWDETWMATARAVALRAECRRDRVGAVIVDAANRVVATGYNGAPSGFPIDEPCTNRQCPRTGATAQLEPGYTDCIAVHAEANALLFCDRRDREGGTIYVTTSVCYPCAKLVANSGLSRVVLTVPPDRGYRDWERVRGFLAGCGLGYTVMTP